MPTCANPRCRAQVDPADAFCAYCGTPVARPAGMGPVAGEAASRGATFPGAPPPPASGLLPPPPPASGLPPAQPPPTHERIGGPNAAYLGHRLVYEKERDLEDLDPLTSGRFWRALLAHTAIVYTIWGVGVFAIAVVAFVLALASLAAGVRLGVVLVLAWCLVMACVFWLRSLPSQVSEWKFMVDGRGQVAPAVIDHVAWSLQRRGTPVDSVRGRRFPVPGQGARDVLEIRQGVFYGLVSCFASGSDLYVGWTLWLRMSPARFLWISVRRIVWEFRFRGSALYVILESDHAKALREALHGAVREGVDVATGQAEPQGRGTLGSAVPIVPGDPGMGQSPWLSAPMSRGR